MEIRRTLWLPLDDLLLLVVREFLNPAVSRSGLARCMKRHGLNTRPVEDHDAPIVLKTFKDYAPGFVHVDIKYLPQMADETARRYLFVAIDRATRWVYLRICRSERGEQHRLPAPPAWQRTDEDREAVDRPSSAVRGLIFVFWRAEIVVAQGVAWAKRGSAVVSRIVCNA